MLINSRHLLLFACGNLTGMPCRTPAPACCCTSHLGTPCTAVYRGHRCFRHFHRHSHHHQCQCYRHRQRCYPHGCPHSQSQTQTFQACRPHKRAFLVRAGAGRQGTARSWLARLSPLPPRASRQGTACTLSCWPRRRCRDNDLQGTPRTALERTPSNALRHTAQLMCLS